MKTNERGITLIALIITVIILLILAGTAISIAVNGENLFGRASQAKEEWNIAVKSEEQEINNVLDYLNQIVNTDDLNTTPETTYPAYSVGDEVSIGNEEFYVLEASDSTQSTVTLFAKYNLNLAGTAQAKNASYEDTACAFSSTYYWENTDEPKNQNNEINLNNVEGYSNGDAMGKAKNYAKMVTGDSNNNTGRLLSLYERQLNGAILNGEANQQGEGSSDYFLIYWLAEAVDGEYDNIWFKYGTNSVITDNMNGESAAEYNGLYYDDYYIGVRPVLTAPKSIVTASI